MVNASAPLQVSRVLPRVCHLVVAAAIATGCTAAPCAALAAVTGHLYVATVGSPFEIERFPLQDGLPAPVPDLKIPGAYFLLAVAPDGTLYAVGNTIDAFAPGNTKPMRRIHFPNLTRQCVYPAGIGGLAVSATGYLFVSYSTYFSGLGPRTAIGARSVRDASFPCIGAVVYAPRADGNATPVSSIAIAGHYVPGAAVDASGRLYLSDTFAYRVREYTSPVRDPDPSGHLTKGISYPNTIRVDAANYLYELDGQSLAKPGVNVYAPGAGNGSGPVRSILFQQQYQWVQDIAVWGKYLYASDNFGPSGSLINVYDATINGAQPPLLSQSEREVGAVAAGP